MGYYKTLTDHYTELQLWHPNINPNTQHKRKNSWKTKLICQGIESVKNKVNISPVNALSTLCYLYIWNISSQFEQLKQLFSFSITAQKKKNCSLKYWQIIYLSITAENLKKKRYYQRSAVCACVSMYNFAILAKVFKLVI